MTTVEQKKMDVCQRLLACPICRRWLANCMVQPVRCHGLSIKDGRYHVGKVGTPSFRWWDDVKDKAAKQWDKERLAFWDANKEDLIAHGWDVPIGRRV